VKFGKGTATKIYRKTPGLIKIGQAWRLKCVYTVDSSTEYSSSTKVQREIIIAL